MILLWYPLNNKTKGADMDYKEALRETKWFQVINESSYESVSLELLSYIFSDYYKDLKGSTSDINNKKMSAECIGAFNLIDEIISIMFHRILNLAQSEFLYGLKDFNTSVVKLLLGSEIHNDYLLYKDVGNIKYCLLSDIKRIIDGEDYDDAMIRKYAFRYSEVGESPFCFDLDKLKSKAISHKRSSGYMERRYRSIAPIVKFGLADEETFSFINENLTKKFRVHCFHLASVTSEKIKRLIKLKEKDDSYSDYTFQELETKLFYNNMITYNTMKDLGHWDQVRYFKNNMELGDIPHLTPLIKDFNSRAKEYFFSECDRIMRANRLCKGNLK